MDIAKIVTDIVERVKADPGLVAKFTSDPEKTIEGLTGIDIPDGQLDNVIAGVKAKIAGTGAANVVDVIGNMFKK